MTIKDGMKLALGIIIVYGGVCLAVDILRVVLFMLFDGGGPAI